MAEDRDRLRQLVADLRAQLAASLSIDANTRRGLEVTIADLEQALSGRPPRPSATGSVAERLGHSAAEFEASHPTLSGTLGALIDAVGRAGI